MQTLLLLGGSPHQAHAIRRAVAAGLRVVTCDNRPENPGHVFAHEYHEVSTTDPEGVLDLARRIGADGILAYASDPAVLTAAYVADRLGLPGDPLEAVRRAQDKLLLRGVQLEVGLPTPDFVDASDDDAVRELRRRHPEGIVVKPVDSSGSRGVTVVPVDASSRSASDAIDRAREQSRSGRVVAEAFWGPGLPESVGDVLVLDGRIRYLGLLTKVSIARPGLLPAPVGGGPFQHGRAGYDEVGRQVQRLVESLGLRNGVYNFDLRIDAANEFAIIDFGARMGGTLVSFVYRARDGIDLVAACIDIAMGTPHEPAIEPTEPGHLSVLVVRTTRDGIFRELRLSQELTDMTIASETAVARGQAVRAYRNSGDQVGVVVIRSEVPDILRVIAEDPERYFTVVLEEDVV